MRYFPVSQTHLGVELSEYFLDTCVQPLLDPSKSNLDTQSSPRSDAVPPSPTRVHLCERRQVRKRRLPSSDPHPRRLLFFLALFSSSSRHRTHGWGHRGEQNPKSRLSWSSPAGPGRSNRTGFEKKRRVTGSPQGCLLGACAPNRCAPLTRLCVIGSETPGRLREDLTAREEQNRTKITSASRGCYLERHFCLF